MQLTQQCPLHLLHHLEVSIFLVVCRYLRVLITVHLRLLDEMTCHFGPLISPLGEVLPMQVVSEPHGALGLSDIVLRR